MVSSREGFLFSEKAAFGQGRAGVDCSTGTSLNMSGEALFGLFGGGGYIMSGWNETHLGIVWVVDSVL